jgi:hypothetical protein
MRLRAGGKGTEKRQGPWLVASVFGVGSDAAGLRSAAWLTSAFDLGCPQGSCWPSIGPAGRQQQRICGQGRRQPAARVLGQQQADGDGAVAAAGLHPQHYSCHYRRACRGGRTHGPAAPTSAPRHQAGGSFESTAGMSPLHAYLQRLKQPAAASGGRPAAPLPPPPSPPRGARSWRAAR